MLLWKLSAAALHLEDFQQVMVGERTQHSPLGSEKTEATPIFTGHEKRSLLQTLSDLLWFWTPIFMDEDQY